MLHIFDYRKAIISKMAYMMTAEESRLCVEQLVSIEQQQLSLEQQMKNSLYQPHLLLTCSSLCVLLYYLCQVNAKSMAEILFLFDVCVSVSVHSGPISQTSLKRLKLQSSEFDVHVPRDSPDMTS